jgi:hypothetical protein
VLDQEHTLTAVEVLHSRMPLEIESRAKAFAGEFLLPGNVAAGLWQKAKSPRARWGNWTNSSANCPTTLVLQRMSPHGSSNTVS